MSSDEPPEKQSRKNAACIFCKGPCGENRKLDEDIRNDLKERSLKWHGLDRYGDLREAVDWKGDITFHKTCKLKVCVIVTVICCIIIIIIIIVIIIIIITIIIVTSIILFSSMMKSV